MVLLIIPMQIYWNSINGISWIMSIQACFQLSLLEAKMICLHPSAMTESDFKSTSDFLKFHVDDFLDFDNLDMSNV